MRFRLPPPHWPPGRRRLLTVCLLSGLAVMAFYAEENLRGSWTLNRANNQAGAAHLPLHPAAVFSPPPQKERNLFYSPAFRNRMIWNSDGRAPEPVFNPAGVDDANLPLPIPWGNIHPAYTSLAANRQPATTDPRSGRSLNLQTTREAMIKLGWGVPEGESPAHDVRTGLDRYRNELAEWASEIRQRPVWAPAPEFFGSIGAFQKLLFTTVRIFALRAVAGAASGRPGSEILSDLESANLLSQHIWSGPKPVNAAIWEIIRSRSLNDSELLALGSQLPDHPLTQTLLERHWMEALPWINEILAPLGRNPEDSVVSYYWDHYTLSELIDEGLPVLRNLKPAGWYRLEEAGMIRMMLENQHWLRQIDANWNSPSPLPIHRTIINRPRTAVRHIRYMDDLGFHMQSCGCPVGTIVHQAVEARLAMVAIGLERHRLRHGTWPATLTDASTLIPGGLRNNPETHRPMAYELLSDGGWKLGTEDSSIVWLMPGSR